MWHEALFLLSLRWRYNKQRLTKKRQQNVKSGNTAGNNKRDVGAYEAQIEREYYFAAWLNLRVIPEPL
jgi:hypothetical protein